MLRTLALLLTLALLGCAPFAAAAKDEKPPAPATPALVIYDVPPGFGREICIGVRGEDGEITYHRGTAFEPMTCPQFFQALQEINAAYTRPGSVRTDVCWVEDRCAKQKPAAARD